MSCGPLLGLRCPDPLTSELWALTSLNAGAVLGLACGCVTAPVILKVDLAIASRWPTCLAPSEPHFGKHTWTFGTVYHPQGSL